MSTLLPGFFRPLGFDPLSLNPILAFDASDSMLAAGGGAAGNLDLVATLENRVLGGVHATQTTATYQPRAHVPVGAGHLYLSGVSGNGAQITSDSTTNINGDIDIRAKLTSPDANWIPSSNSMLVARDQVSGSNRTYTFYIRHTTGFLDFTFYNASGVLVGNLNSGARPQFSAGETGYVRVTREASSGNVKYWKSDDGTSWTQVGSTKSTPAGGMRDNSSVNVTMGFRADGNALRGALHEVQIYSSIDETSKVLDVDFSNATHKASSFVCSTGQTVSINTSGQDPATIVKRSFLRFDGADNFLTGSFNESNTTGGYMFVVYSVNGNGGEESGRVFVMNSAGEAGFFSVRAFLWSLRKSNEGNIAYYHASVFRGIHTLGFDPVDGTLLHEVKAVDGTQFSKVNNGDIQTSSLDLSSLSSEEFDIGASPQGGSNPAIDIEALYLFDHTLTQNDATKVRDYLNAKSSIYRRITDSDALAYINALEGDGVSVSRAQKEAIEDFYVTAKSGGWYSSLKRLYLPIWGAAAPNARCLVSSTSGTFNGSFTYATGYAHPTAASNVNHFNTGYKLLDDLTTEDACLMALAYDDTSPHDRAINAANKTLIGAGAITANSVRINTVSSSLKPQACWLGVNESTLPTFGSHGVLLSNRKDGDTTLSRRTGSAYDEDSTTGTLTGTYNNSFPIVGFGSAASSTGSATQATDSNAGAFGIGDGLNATDRASYTDAVKTLWETCSGITL